MLYKEIKSELKTIENDIEEYEKKLEELKKRKNELLKLKEKAKKKKQERQQEKQTNHLSKRKYVSDKELDIILNKKTIKDAASIIKDFLRIESKVYFSRYAQMVNPYGWAMREMVILNVPFSEKDKAKGLGCSWIKDIKKWATNDEGDNFEKIIKRWGYNNKNIAYKFEIKDDYYRERLLENKEVKKLIDSGDLKAKMSKYGDCKKLFMYEMNANIKKFKKIYKDLINR